MSSTYDKGFRSKYLLTAHVVFVTKYRRKVINKALHDFKARDFQRYLPEMGMYVT